MGAQRRPAREMDEEGGIAMGKQVIAVVAAIAAVGAYVWATGRPGDEVQATAEAVTESAEAAADTASQTAEAAGDAVADAFAWGLAAACARVTEKLPTFAPERVRELRDGVVIEPLAWD